MGTGVLSGEDDVSEVDATLVKFWDCCCSCFTSSTILKIWLIFILDDGVIFCCKAAFNLCRTIKYKGYSSVAL